MFTYVKNNPILYVDPSGYVGFFASMAIGIAVEAALTLGFPMLKVIPFLIDILAELITMVIINVLNKLEALYGITPETIITIAITAVAGGLALGFLAKKIGPLLKGKKAIAEAAEEGLEAISENADNVARKLDVEVRTSAGGEVRPMKMERQIQPGESINSLKNELKQLTFTTGNEHAIVSLKDGTRHIVSGGPGGISNLSDVKRLIAHTHPFDTLPTGPSSADFNALRQLGQKSSYLLEQGNIYKFFR